MEMPESLPDRNDRAGGFGMEALIGYILLTGVLLSIALIIAGLIWHWLLTGSLVIRYVIKGDNLSGFLVRIADQLAAGSVGPYLILDIGICVLLLTPFVRVFASVVYFALAEHNWKYAGFTCAVLVILTYSLFFK